MLLGYSYLSNESEWYGMNNFGFQDDYFGGWHNIGVGNALQEGFAGMSSGKFKKNLISFFLLLRSRLCHWLRVNHMGCLGRHFTRWRMSTMTPETAHVVSFYSLANEYALMM